MKKFNIPSIGLRNLKTALSVFLCILIFKFFNNNYPFYACISAVICMKDTVDNSLNMGKDRLIGTFLGGMLGFIFIYVLSFFPYLNHPNALITALGVIICIYICTFINKPGSVSICCIVFIGIMISYTGLESYYYAISRTFDTAVGVIIAILVNKYVNPPFMKITCDNNGK